MLPMHIDIRTISEKNVYCCTLTNCLQGTIVEWTIAVGQAVKAEDVVCLIETDKVTIDIKAISDGVLTQQFGGV